MKNSYLTVIIGLLLYLISGNSASSANEKAINSVQKCTLIFRTQEEITAYVYKPIDDTYNNWYVSDKLDLKPNISINYQLGVNNFEFVRCKFSNGDRKDILVFPGDSVEINCEPQKIVLSGSNATGQNYYNDNYIERGLDHDNIMRQHMNKYPINYDSVYYYFEKGLIAPYQTDLKKMETSGSITPAFSSILAKNLYFGCCFVLRSSYEQWLIFGNSPIKERPSQEDIRSILQQLSQLFDSPYATSDDVKKMPYHLGSYYNLKYKYLDNETKEKLKEKCNFDEDSPSLLLAPDSLQLRYYGNELILSLQTGTSPFDHEKLLAYLSGKFPDSEYVAIIKKLMAQKQSSKTGDEIVIIDDSLSSIKELMQIDGIKGKYAYIDLWATWCMPCTMEFQYNDDIHAILSQYNNIAPVYISIDADRQLWESRVKKFNLNGYNIMASKSLNEDIGTKVYKAKQVGSIPRYLLLDPEGNIVNDNLPRPSKSTLLKPILANALK